MPIEPKVDGLDGYLCVLRKVLQCLQCTVKERDGLRVRGASDGFGSGLTPMRHRFVPQVAVPRMMGEPFDVLPEAIPMKRLDRPNDSRMQVSTTLLQHAAVGHLMGERVREGVLQVR